MSMVAAHRETVDIEINSFFRSWKRFEDAQTGEQATVFDFDYSPRREGLEQFEFSDRFDVLDKLLECLDLVKQTPKGVISNQDFLYQKLRGAEVYLRQVLGEKIPFDACIAATLGIVPAPVTRDTLKTLESRARQSLSKLGYAWKGEERARMQQEMAFENGEAFGQALRKSAHHWLNRLSEQMFEEVAPEYEVEIVRKDEYWTNWIDGEYGAPIKLKVNTHPRANLMRGREDILAAHEIAGHAAQMLFLSRSTGRGEMEPCMLNVSLHGCEMFQMEGLAQTILHVLAREGELSPEIQLHENLSAYHSAWQNNAQIELEAGKPIETIMQETLRAAPLLSPLRLKSGLRDRSRNPIFRSLIFVYYPSWEMFSRVLPLAEAGRLSFLKAVYSKLMTPRQIEALLIELEAEL